jgi:hypothetical protein
VYPINCFTDIEYLIWETTSWVIERFLFQLNWSIIKFRLHKVINAHFIIFHKWLTICAEIRYWKLPLKIVWKFISSSILIHNKSRDSSDVIAMGYGLGCRGSISGMLKWFFRNSQCPDRLWYPPSHLSNGYRWRSGRCGSWPLTILCQGQERWIYICTPPHVFMA